MTLFPRKTRMDSLLEEGVSISASGGVKDNSKHPFIHPQPLQLKVDTLTLTLL
jgi:hypothetical protein